MSLALSHKSLALETKISIPGNDGLLEGRMHVNHNISAPIAVVFHPHPLHGGTMNNKIVYALCKIFQQFGFHTLRINFRGVGKSQGHSIGGDEELDDALAAIDWFTKKCAIRNTDTVPIWVAGFSFGGWIALQAAMRRPEISGFISVSPPVETYQFNMLTPCPNGLILQGNKDHIVAAEAVKDFSNQLIRQKGCQVDYNELEADHYYTDSLSSLETIVTDYLKELLV